MFGLILVEPPEGLPKGVDREFYVMQHEMYPYELDHDAPAKQMPSHVLFNGREGTLVEKP